METKNLVELPLSGVDSEHCALIVDKGLSKVEGIRTHKVELNNNRAVITTNDDLETIPKAVKAIRDLGYDVSTVKKTFPVLKSLCIHKYSCTADESMFVIYMTGSHCKFVAVYFLPDLN